LIGDPLVDIVTQRTNVKQLPIATGYLTPDILPLYETLDVKCFSSIDVNPECDKNLCDTAVKIIQTYSPDLDAYDV